MEKLGNETITQNVDLEGYDWAVDEEDPTLPFLRRISVKGTQYDLHGDKDRVFVYTAEASEGRYICVADIPLEKKTVGGVTCYHPVYTRIDERFQGKGLAKHFYIAISKSLRIKLRSGTTQSPGSVKLWAALAKSTRVTMLGYRRYLGWNTVYVKNREVFCDVFSPYDLKSDALVMEVR